MKLDSLVGMHRYGWLKRRRSHNNAVGKGTPARLRLCVYGMAHWAALHPDDRMIVYPAPPMLRDRPGLNRSQCFPSRQGGGRAHAFGQLFERDVGQLMVWLRARLLWKPLAPGDSCQRTAYPRFSVLTRVMLTGQKYSVVRATLLQAGPHALHLDDEPAIAQTLLEFPILAGRPDGQDSAAFESGTNGS